MKLCIVVNWNPLFTDRFIYTSWFTCNFYSVMDHPYITSAKGMGWWGKKTAIFADVQFYLCWRRSGWIRKSPKVCSRNIRMVPNTPHPHVWNSLNVYTLTFFRINRTQQLKVTKRRQKRFKKLTAHDIFNVAIWLKQLWCWHA